MLNSDIRVGLGHDTHRLAADRELILGGVTIPFDRGLAGHSDADVLLHAITDALLGAAGLGDIGEMFPDTDPQFRDADSSQFVQLALQSVRSDGWRIANLDCTVCAERPRLSKFKPSIKAGLSELLEIDSERINIKAKTGEKVGPVGREEAITADAVVLLVRNGKEAGTQHP